MKNNLVYYETRLKTKSISHENDTEPELILEKLNADADKENDEHNTYNRLCRLNEFKTNYNESGVSFFNNLCVLSYSKYPHSNFVNRYIKANQVNFQNQIQDLY